MPPNERLSALRLQAQAWQAFERHAARLIIWDEVGLAIAWDEAGLERDLAEQGLALDRCWVVPELLVQQPMDGGVRLVRSLEGVDAQCWHAGQLNASRWWPIQPSVEDWLTFLRAAGQTVASDEAGGSTLFDVPQATEVLEEATPWVRHHSMQAAGDSGHHELEGWLVYLSAVCLAFAAGAAAHQFLDAWRLQSGLQAQLAELKGKADKALVVRDKAIGELASVQKLASFGLTPQPMEVIGHLHETLARTGIQIKELELEGERLKLGLQLGPNVARASIVKALQSGGWFADVNEARGDGAGRALLALELKIKGAHAPAARADDATAAASPAPNSPPQGAMQPTPAMNQPAPPKVARTPIPSATQRGTKPTADPVKPIFAKPDANGMPPADVFDAIPSR